MSRPMCPHMGEVGSGAIANNSSIATVIGYSKKLYDLTGRASSSSYVGLKAGASAILRDKQPVLVAINISYNC